MFEKEVYVSRRKKLVSLMARTAPEGKRGIALFIGNVDAPAQYKSNGYKFRQDSTWLYYFGLNEPRFAAILDLDAGTETLYSDDYAIDDIIWTGPMPGEPRQPRGHRLQRALCSAGRGGPGRAGTGPAGTFHPAVALLQYA